MKEGNVTDWFIVVCSKPSGYNFRDILDKNNLPIIQLVDFVKWDNLNQAIMKNVII